MRLCAAAADAAAAGPGTPVSHERVVEATASSPAGTYTKSRSSVDEGSFAESIAANSSGARCRLATTFVVEGTVAFSLQGNLRLGRTMLTGPAGVVFESGSIDGPISHAGFLTEGTYTFVAEAVGLFADFDVRFSAGGTPVEGPRCTVRMTRSSYGSGLTVAASVLRIENPLPHPVFVEVKMWLRLPDGSLIPARNDGADGSVVLPGGMTQNFAPLDVMGVGPQTAPGVWEFGCRLLDPVTGEQLSKSTDLFEIH